MQPVKYFTVGVLALASLFPVTIPAMGQEILADNHGNCSEASDQFVADYTDGSQIEIPIRTVIQARSGHPVDRDKTYTFMVTGEDARFVQPTFSHVARNGQTFLDACPDAGSILVSFPDLDKEWEFGIVDLDYGTIRRLYVIFRCAEGLDIYPTEGNIDPMHWGLRFCSI